LENDEQRTAANLPVRTVKKRLKNSESAEYKVDQFESIDIFELWEIIWGGKWFIILVTAIFGAASVVYALSKPNIYRSEVLLMPVNEAQGNGFSRFAGQLGGLASLAGVNLGGGSGDKTSLALEVMKSRSFVAKVTDEFDVLPELLAAKDWDKKTGKIIYDSRVYDESKKEWLIKEGSPKPDFPTDWDAYKAYLEAVKINYDSQTRMVEVWVEHVSPFFAKKLAEIVVMQTNSYLKELDVQEALKSIDYLQVQLGKTQISDMKKVFYQLIEEQTKTMMLAEVREQYIFTIVDPAVVPEEKLKPKRSMLVLIGLVIGGFLGVILVFLKDLGSQIKRRR